MPEIKFTEEELETYFCEVADEEFECRIIGRQIRLECGVLDVLMKSRVANLYFVVELKKGCLSDADLAQVSAYTAELRCRFPSRKFISVLLGQGISAKYLHYALDRFRNNQFPVLAYYIIFGWDMESGVSFDWFNQDQNDHEKYRNDLCRVAADLIKSRWKESRGASRNVQ